MRELIMTLEREAEARSEAILEEAREAAVRVAEDAERELGRRVEQQVEAREREWRRDAGGRVAVARRAAEEHALTARAELLREVFERAAKRLADIPASPRYETAAPALLERALSFLPPGDVEVLCDPATARAVAPTAERARARIEARPGAAPGLVARAIDGSVSVDATLEALLERLRPSLAMEIAARLEGEA
jgi:vacuolar-type H+-ATPase subunit E/Vma4